MKKPRARMSRLTTGLQLIRIPALCSFLVFGLLTPIATLHADRGSFASYEKALRAVRFKQWEEAAESLRQAIAEKPEEIAGPVTRPYGMHFEPYLPHFYLGLALCKLGRAEEALEHWRHSDEQGAVARTQKAADLLEKRQQCELTFLPQALEEARRTRESAGRTIEHLRDISPQNSEIWSSTRQRRLESLHASFESTNRHFVAIASDPPLDEVLNLTSSYRQQQDQAEELAQELHQARQQTSKRQALKLREALSTFRFEMEQTRAAAEALEAQLAEAETPLPSELEQRIHQVVDRVRQMNLALSEAELAEVTLDRLQSWRQQWTNLRSSIANLSQRVEGSRLPVELLEAATELFAGNYAQTLEKLSTRTFPRPRSKAQASLLRAAAHHGLYLASARSDTAHLRRAREEITSCRRIDPLLEPDAQFFSPRFQKLFKSTLRK